MSIIEKNAYSYKKELKEFEVPSDVTEIGEYAFLYCTELTKIYIPASVTKIGRSAFSGCEKLEIYCENERPKAG